MASRSLRPKGKLLLAMILIVCFSAFYAGCGNQDYEKPIQQFQQASTTVISSMHDFLSHMNQIEEDEMIDRKTFDREKIDLDKIKQDTLVITQAEISARTKALDALSSYTTNLANLIQAKNMQAIADNTKTLQITLGQLAQDSKSLSVSTVSGVDNAKFSGAVQLAAVAISSVAQALAERKARRTLEETIRNNDASVTDLIKLIEEETGYAYERQKHSLGNQRVVLMGDYNKELDKGQSADPVLMMFLADRMKYYYSHAAALDSTDPEPAIQAMRKAHSALVAYVYSNKGPKDLAGLVASAEDFFKRAQPLGEATAALLKAK
jgi:hypothetical protein